jgi:OOP family OmpA-OmpF porin
MKTLLNFLLLCVGLAGNAQNLIDNGGFETYTALPTNVMQSNLCSGWSKCNQGGGGSPDYFHTGGSGLVSLPNSFYATVNPHGGNAVMGLIAYHGVSTDFREYIAHSLTTPLLVGHTYTVSYYVTNGQYNGNYGGCGSTNLAVALTTSEPMQNTTGPISGIIPQHIHSTVLYSCDWQAVSFTFVADSAYQYLTMGNFKDNNSTQVQNIENASIETVYYFIDDISIVEENGHSEVNELLSNTANVFYDINSRSLKLASNLSGPNKFKLTTINGTLLKTVVFQEETVIDLSEYPSGTYFYQIQGNTNSNQVGKLIFP